MQNLLRKSLSNWSLDLRTLAVARILIGIILVKDWVDRILSLDTFYSDHGLFPRQALMEDLSYRWNWSLLFLTGETVQLFILMLVGLSFYFFFLIGYRTRLFSVLSWIFFVSILSRNPLVIHGGDDLLRVGLFWFCFLPTNYFLSIDRKLNPKQFANLPTVTSIASFGIIFQLCSMYFFTAVLKNHPIWHTEGSAIWYSLHIDSFSRNFALLLRHVPRDLLALATKATLGMELFAPILILSPLPWPKFTSWTRIAVPLTLIIFHLGLAISFPLNLFPWICIVFWIALLPAKVFELLPFWKPTWFVAPKANLSLPNKTMAVEFGFMQRKHRQFRNALRSLQNAFLIFCVGLVLFWNVRGLGDIEKFPIPSPWFEIGNSLQLYQRWHMFAPYPFRDDGWFVIEGKLSDGSQWNTFENKVISFEKPESLFDHYRNSLWRKYLINIRSEDFEYYLPYFARWLCRDWNENRKENQLLQTFKIHFLLETSPDYTTGEQLRDTQLLWRQYCFHRPADWQNDEEILRTKGAKRTDPKAQ